MPMEGILTIILGVALCAIICAVFIKILQKLQHLAISISILLFGLSAGYFIPIWAATNLIGSGHELGYYVWLIALNILILISCLTYGIYIIVGNRSNKPFKSGTPQSGAPLLKR
jgi:hypothetical protein